MSPISLAGAIAMLEWGNEDGRLITSVIAGLRDLQEKEAAPIDTAQVKPGEKCGPQPEVIGFGEPDVPSD
jgi:hypothetical protein